MRFAIVALLLFALGTGSASAQAPDPSSLDCTRVDSAVTRFMDRSMVPGAAVAILRNGQPLCVGTYGVSDLELETPVTRETVFEIASLTKQMTAALTATLAGEGVLSLTDKLVRYIDEAPEAWTPITVRQLLGHMAGLQHRFESTVDGVYLLDYSKESMLLSAKETPMFSTPGTDWEYSDQGYFLAGVVVERATGRDFASLMADRFFEPLGMTRTTFLDQDDLIKGRAAGYTVVDGVWKNNRRSWEFELTPHFGVMSTIDDMIRWEGGLVDNDVIAQDVVEVITEPYRIFVEQDDKLIAYGLGWQIHDFGERRITQHAGYTGTSYVRDLTTGLSIIVLTNRDSNAGPHPGVLSGELARIADPTFPELAM